MSAYVVDKAHINAMLNSWIHSNARWFHNGWHELTTENANEVGQMLLDENIRSVMCRYEDSTITDLPGRIDAEYLIPFVHRYTRRKPKAIEAIKLAQCLDYQSCEHPEWETSEAKAFCDALIQSMIFELPGYDDAPWEWREPVTEQLQRIGR